MRFDAIVLGKPYHFTPLQNETYLITGSGEEFILYKSLTWRCADEIPHQLLQALGATIDASSVRRMDAA